MGLTDYIVKRPGPIFTSGNLIVHAVLFVTRETYLVHSRLLGRFTSTFHEYVSKEWGRVILRHTELTAYRCFLPDLAGFTGFYCTGPSPYSGSSSQYSLQSTLEVSIRPRELRYSDKERAVHTKCGMAERVGFEPTVPLPGRMLSKHVDSSTLAPLRIEKCKEDAS